MKFFIELTGQENFRLQKDQSWRLITPLEPLMESDFLTSEVIDIIRLQEVNGERILNNEKWRINPDFHTIYGDHLHYRVFVSRESYPLLPSLEQLRSVIKQGDEHLSYLLILNVYGFYELRESSTINLRIVDPTIVCYVDKTIEEEGISYVGKAASNHDSHIKGLYLLTLEFWLEHLKTGLTNLLDSDDYSGLSLTEVDEAIEKSREEFFSNK